MTTRSRKLATADLFLWRVFILDEVISWLNPEPTPDLATVVRRSGLIGKRISFPVDPRPVEGLADLIFRAASENGFWSPRPLLEQMGIGRNCRLSARSLYRRAHALDTGRISDVLGTSFANAAEAVAPTPRRGGEGSLGFFGRDVRSPMFFSNLRRIAPKTLAMLGYQKAIWSVLDLSFDPATKEKLISKCPECNHQLTYEMSYGVEVCGSCFERGKRIDLRDIPLDQIKIDDVEALDIVTNLINPEFPLTALSSLSLPSELMQSGPGALFALLTKLARYATTCASQGSSETYHQLLPVELATVGRAMMKWPEGLRDYGDRLWLLWMKAEKRTASAQSDVNDIRLRRPHTGQFNHPLEFACEGYDKGLRDRVVKHGVGMASDRSRLLGFLSDTLKDTEHSSTLKRSSVPTTSYNPRWRPRSASKAAMEAISQFWAGLGTDRSYEVINTIMGAIPRFSEVSSELGIALPYLSDLISMGIIDKVDDDIDRLMRDDVAGTGSNLAHQLDELACRSERPIGALPLQDVCAALITERVNPWPSLLTSMLNGKLRFWTSSVSASLMKRVAVWNFDQVRNLISDAPMRPDVYRVPTQHSSLAIAFGTRIDVMHGLRREGFVNDMTLENLWRFRAKHIMVPEIKLRLAMNSINRAPRSLVSELCNVAFRHSPQPNRRVRFFEREAVEDYYGGNMVPKAM